MKDDRNAWCYHRMMTEVGGATSHMMMKVGVATSHMMMKVGGATI